MITHQIRGGPAAGKLGKCRFQILALSKILKNFENFFLSSKKFGKFGKISKKMQKGGKISEKLVFKKKKNFLPKKKKN